MGDCSNTETLAAPSPLTILKHLQSKMNLESRYKSLFLLKNCHIISLLYDYTVDFILNSDAEIHV